MLNDALKLAKLGFPVFPLSAGSKIPLAGSNGVKDATTDPDKIRVLWLSHPNANTGLALGQKANVVAIDLDKGATESDLARFPRTVTAKTKNGWHLFFRYREGIPNTQEFTLQALEAGGVPVCVNIRSTDYYVVGVGSVVADWEYRWHGDAGGELGPGDVAYAEIPDWILPAPKNYEQQTQSNEEETRQGSKVHGENGRHAFFVKAATAARKEGKQFDEILAKLHLLNQTNCVPPKPDCHDELVKIVQWVFGKTNANNLGRPAGSGSDNSDAAEGVGNRTGKVGRPREESAHELVEQFIDELNYRDKTGLVALRYYRQDFYEHRESYYKAVHNENIDDQINRWLIRTGREARAGGYIVDKMRRLLRIRPILVDADIELPVLVNGTQIQSGKHLIPFRNGLFDIQKFLATGEVTLQPHTPNYVSTYCLPFDFDPIATAPTYERVANASFGDSEKKKLWEEIIGVHLYQPFPLEHFFMFQGEGSNGKSVLIRVLTSLLGAENVSSVPLECFHPENFSFSKTYGKVANIIPDQHDIEDINEGLLKQFVTREPMTFNRKFKEPFTALPTAFLTICCNSLPRFVDKTDGIWRRLLVFHFPNQVSEADRDTRFISDTFWSASGELAGVFNLALAGLRRVVDNGRLSIPASMDADKAKLRVDGDNIAAFLAECVTPSPNTRIASVDVYRAYKRFAEENGTRPVATSRFASRMQVGLKKRGIQSDYPDKKFKFHDSLVSRSWQGVSLNAFGLQFIDHPARVAAMGQDDQF